MVAREEYFLPSMYSERLHELIVAIDTSGSISQDILNTFGSVLANVCEAITPDMVRVLWWDTEVHGEQIFEENFTQIMNMLKPMGGGGTTVGCVSRYIADKNFQPDCVLVLTDGYVEHNPDWRINFPTLWLVTQNEQFNPPAGRKVNVR
jgi:predicted metal-dependent peptidase